MKTLQEILAGYHPISLEQVQIADLMSRVEVKYTFNKSQLTQILEELIDDYRVLTVNKNTVNPYETIYFDTPTYSLYYQHHNSIFNRFKIRQRRYVSSGDSFLEIKFRNNKNRVIKERITTDSLKDYIGEDGLNLINTKTSIDSSQLKPTLWVYFDRITLVNSNFSERITIDTNLSFRYDDKVVSYPNIAIAEVKQEIHFRSTFIQLMKKSIIRDVSNSKYCIGLASVNENIKKNNFKHKLMSLQKLSSEN
ncbi:MAG: polyphosphate polymerase domain-containing protein [Bacteroidota bacterium]